MINILLRSKKKYLIKNHNHEYIEPGRPKQNNLASSCLAVVYAYAYVFFFGIGINLTRFDNSVHDPSRPATC
jgi:hypothetical protein